MNHVQTDQFSLELARRVADRLRQQPEVLNIARTNLARWSKQNRCAPSLLRCYAEWQQILSGQLAVPPNFWLLRARSQ